MAALPNASSDAFASPADRVAIHGCYDAVLDRWPVEHRCHFVDTARGRAHVISSGPSDAPPLVLLHGGGGNATMWIHNIAALAEDRRVHALDIIGDVGKSEGARPSSADGFVRWLAEVVEALGLDRPALAGASFGAWLAHHFVLTHPERVDAVALLAPPHLERLRAGFLIRALLANALPTRKRLVAFFRYLGSPSAPPLTESAIEDWILRWRGQRQGPSPPPRASDQELAGLPAGCLVMLGADDPFYDVGKAADRIRRWAPEARLVILERAGHTLTLDRHADVSEALRTLRAG